MDINDFVKGAANDLDCAIAKTWVFFKGLSIALLSLDCLSLSGRVTMRTRLPIL